LENLKKGYLKVISKWSRLAVVWENAQKFRHLSANCRKFDILDGTGGTKVNAFSNQNWP
jgi:hypothetical protein